MPWWLRGEGVKTTENKIHWPRWLTEVESKEKYGVSDPMPELTITSPYVHFRVDSNTFTMGWA
jgi:hypothetical protein